MNENTARALTMADIMKRLPHRHPFLLIDRVISHGDGKAVAMKNVSINEPFFVGHFPSMPVMPGVLIGEAMAQTAAFVGEGVNGGAAYLVSMDLKLERPVFPGDQVVLTARLVKQFAKLKRISATAEVDGQLVAKAEITVTSG